MGKFINPFTDWGFKRIFGQEDSKDLLIGLLNSLLEGERHIVNLTFLNNEQQPVVKEGRNIVYDIYCLTDAGERIIVEMQNEQSDNFKDRALYYLSRAIVAQGQKGDRWNYEITAVYGVFLMNFKSSEFTMLRTDVILVNRDTGELFSDKIRELFISFPYFEKAEKECKTNFERWTFVLKNMETLERMPFKAEMSVLRKLEKIANVRNLTKEEQAQYEVSLKRFRDSYSVYTLQKKREAEIKQGRKELRQNRKEIKQHQKEIKQKDEALAKQKEALLKVALIFKEQGATTQFIVENTGLSVEEVEKL